MLPVNLSGSYHATVSVPFGFGFVNVEGGVHATLALMHIHRQTIAEKNLSGNKVLMIRDTFYVIFYSTVVIVFYTQQEVHLAEQ